jgi:hypothetical protein
MKSLLLLLAYGLDIGWCQNGKNTTVEVPKLPYLFMFDT